MSTRHSGQDSRPASLPRPVQELLDAANAGDSDAFLGCFPPDGVVDDWGRLLRGLAAIRGWSDAEFIGVAVSLTVLDVSTDGTVTTVLAQVGGRGFTGASHFAFTTDGATVSLMQIRG